MGYLRILILVACSALVGCPDIHASSCLRACNTTSDLCLTSVRDCRDGCKGEGGGDAKDECRAGCDDAAQQCWRDFSECVAACAAEVEEALSADSTGE